MRAGQIWHDGNKTNATAVQLRSFFAGREELPSKTPKLFINEGEHRRRDAQSQSCKCSPICSPQMQHTDYTSNQKRIYSLVRLGSIP